MGSNHTLRPSEGGTVTRGSPANRDALRALLKPETTAWKYNHGVPDNDGGLAERVLARQFLNLPARRGQGATRPVRRLQEQRRALSDLPGVYPDWPHRTETTHSSCRRGRGVQARHPERDCALLRYQTFRAGDACPRGRGGHSRLPSLNDNVNRNSPDASSRRKEGDDHGQAGALHVESRDPAAFR